MVIEIRGQQPFHFLPAVPNCFALHIMFSLLLLQSKKRVANQRRGGHFCSFDKLLVILKITKKLCGYVVQIPRDAIAR